MKELSPEQVARLRPEARERYEKRLKIVKRNRKILSISCIGVSAVLVILILSMTVLFNISSINIGKKSTKYTVEEIVMASGLNIGDNMVRTNFSKVEERIEKSLPYIKDAVINKSISGKITIDIIDTKATTIIKCAQGYAIADADGKTLEIVKSVPENNTLTAIHLKGAITAAPGEFIVLSDAEEQALYDSLKAVLASEGLLSGITDIDLTQRSSLKLIYQNRLRLLLGTADNLEEKIKSGAQVIEKENEQDPELVAEINLTIPKKVYVNPMETLYPVEEEEKDKDASNKQDEPESSEDTTEPTKKEDTSEKTDEPAESETTRVNSDTEGDSGEAEQQ